MTIIAVLKAVTNREGLEELQGEVKTLEMSLKVRFVPNRPKRSEKAPDYKILGGHWDDKAVQVGNAWKQTKIQSDGSIFEFMSVTIDDPSLPNALNVAAFRNDDGDWELTWRRRQPKQAIA